jgi:hypothetical protein
MTGIAQSVRRRSATRLDVRARASSWVDRLYGVLSSLVDERYYEGGLPKNLEALPPSERAREALSWHARLGRQI